ncbi:uncharacterized protein BP5553_03776 [Venustampulla echinocandica]|uniref:Dihydroxyacetone kinase n=1 Tax=Venustampulla echinocandica TaxID=2656787 RepID=A0A370TV88_9HELO|nr:uncharacterized protein BP5553_03776 [Venustampulla echinocandica]RDL39436.1 hypothetical protein BP5553_03776 [Venustampulla echinocandica]
MSSPKHFINDPTHLVNSALKALTITNPAVALDAEHKVIYRRPTDAAKQVAIVSGGGSGHEPSFGAFVGDGLLSAAVAGTIFASPSSEQIRQAITARVDAEKGILVTVMNYTGDVLNFGMAVEKAKSEGFNVEMLVVGDDVGVGRIKSGKVGRRGIAGTVLVHKISGALAARGASLQDVYNVAKLTADNIVSVGASLDHVHVPGRAPAPVDAIADERLATEEVEIGMGIHNEPGSGRAVVALPELVSRMLQQLLDWKDEDRAYLNVNSNEVVVLINNLGGISVLELGGITTEVIEQLEKTYKIKPARVLAGTYMTSLNGLGFSISILNTVNTNIGGPSMIQLLDDPCEATGWAAPIRKETWEAKSSQVRDTLSSKIERAKTSGLKLNPEAARASLTAGLERLILSEPDVTKYDTVVGDGDCGICLKRGAEAILKELNFSGDAAVDVSKVARVVESSMDGTSGAIYAIYLNALITSLQEQAAGEATAKVWAAALKYASEALSKYTPAQPGDRTLIDALYPFVDTLNSTGDVKQAALASRKGAAGTKGMQASLGRAVYIGGSGFEQVPDPGAWGLISAAATAERFPSPDAVRSPSREQEDLHRAVRCDNNDCQKDTEPTWQIALRKKIELPQLYTTSEEPSIITPDEPSITTPEESSIITPPLQLQLATMSITDSTAMSLSSNSSSGTIVEIDIPRTFHPFARLPITVRRHIWSLNMPGPRLVEVVEDNNDFIAFGKQITNLYICRESRREAHKTHPLSFSVNYNPPMVPFNFETDTLLLGRRLIDEDNHIYFRTNCDQEELAKVRRLMVDTELVWDEWQYSNKRQSRSHRSKRDRGAGLCGMSRLVFKGVEEYTALYTGLADPLPAWAEVTWFPVLRQHSQRWRCTDADAVEVYQFLQENWWRFDNHRLRWPVDADLCEEQRYGGIPWYEKWEPAIKRWTIPMVSTLGVEPEVMAAFNWPVASGWAEMVMDRAIGDLFY